MENMNEAAVAGEVASAFRYSHESNGEKFYMVDLACERMSGTMDIIPVMVSERMGTPKNGRACVSGKVRTYNDHRDGKHRLRVFIFAESMAGAEIYGINKVAFDGFICRQPKYRRTPLGRELTEITLAVNRNSCKADYIPCICWGRDARFASTMAVGAHVEAEGRFQSREYSKLLTEGKYEVRTAYEISLSRIRAAGEEKHGRDMEV